MYQCGFCNYKSIYKYNVLRHEEGKHRQNSNNNNQNSNKIQQPLEPQLKTSYMQGYSQVQPAYHGQVVQQQPVYNEQLDHQEPVYYDQVDHPPHIQFNPQTNVMVVRNRYLQNKVNELENLLRNQNVQKVQTFKTNEANDSEIMSDVMETDEQDSMDSNSVDSDTESVSPNVNVDGDEEQENVDNLNDKINKIRYALLEFKDLRDDYRSELENVKNFDTEQLRYVLENYADLEVEILEEQVGVDPEENGRKL